MAKPTITTRAGKGSALTWTEGDTNLENLRDATITVKADTGGTDVVSDLNGTVTLVAGTNVTITGDNTAKTVTINSTASGGATDLNGLSDVDYSGAAITSGDILKWTTGPTGGYFTNATNNLSGLSDVQDMMSPSDGNVLTYDSTNNYWKPVAPSSGGATDLNGLTDVDYSGAGIATGDILKWTTGPSGGYFTNATNNISGLSDVKDMMSPSNGDVLAWNSSNSQWENTAASGGASALSDLSDVSLGTPASGEVLYYNGTNWVDTAINTLTVDNVSGTVALANGGTGKTTAPAALAALMGFTTTATAAGTTLLTNTSTHYQIFTGTTTQTVRMPDTSTLATGWSFHICNNSTGVVQLTTSASNFLFNIPAGVTAMSTCINTGSNAATSWEVGVTDFSTLTGTGSVVLSTSPSLTTPNLGTPSAIVLTNASGTASININGTVGVTTPAEGNFTTIGLTSVGAANFTTLTASSTVSGSGFTARFASPGPIGNTTASTGAFTTLSATTSASLKAINEGALYDLGTTGGTIAPNVANGNVQKITLNSALTINAFTSPVAGQSLTLIIYGGTAYTSITSTMKFAGGVKTLTGTAGCIDILSVYYDGTNYFASLGKGFA